MDRIIIYSNRKMLSKIIGFNLNAIVSGSDMKSIDFLIINKNIIEVESVMYPD